MNVIGRCVLLVPFVGALCACGGTGGSSDPSAGGNEQTPAPPTTGRGSWTVRLNWQDGNEPRLAGYRVYHGLTSAAIDEKYEAGLATTFAYSTDNGGIHYFALAAVDVSGAESPRSGAIMLDLK
jgi:hypothetical protein